MPTHLSLDRSGRICSSDLEWFTTLYRAMVTCRYVDEMEANLVGQGSAFFHVSAAGHEGAAVLARHLRPSDWLHCHYRDKALLLARGIHPKAFFDGLLANADSHSAGRQMSAHMSDPSRNVLSIVGPVGNGALQAVGVAAEVKEHSDRPIVLCSVGDGTTQQGEYCEAIAEAVRANLPVLFWVEDNRLSISTRTEGKTFYDLPNGRAGEFYGLPIHRLDGVDLVTSDVQARAIVDGMRSGRGPAIVVFSVERLCNHTNADDERVYRSDDEIRAARRLRDPVERLAVELTASGVSEGALTSIARVARQEVERAAAASLAAGEPEPAMTAKRPLARRLAEASSEYVGHTGGERLTLLEAMRAVLGRWLSRDPRMTLLGEDIEDPKGDVFGLTRGLSTAFPGRVTNSALSESTIVGTAIGRALAGGRAVACVQFADFLPLAFNQISSELASIYWRTNGGWECPVIVLAACGAYRPGLGPFHAQTLESILAHTPGIDVFMPSSAADAAGLLNAALESRRPSVFLYPKACLNDPDRSTSDDVHKHLVPIGKARRLRQGSELTIVTWGSTVPLCEQVAKSLSDSGRSVELVDLRSLSPWDAAAVAESARKTRRLLVVHEDNLTCGFGAEVVAATVEAVGADVSCRRLARGDTHIPCNYRNQESVLPSYRTVLEEAARMLGLAVSWQSPSSGDGADASHVVQAYGSSPADESVTVVAWDIATGDSIAVGQSLAEAEADKAVFEIKSPVAGTVRELSVAEGETVRVGAPLLRVDLREPVVSAAAVNSSANLVPRFRASVSQPAPRAGATRRSVAVAVSRPYCAVGSVGVNNDEIAAGFSEWTARDIFRRTGIERRCRMRSGETALDLAVSASTAALEREGVTLNEIDSVICSTTTPADATPSMACRVLHALGSGGMAREIPAYDISAACSGYLYALAAAYDFIQAHPEATVLVVTAEALSSVIDRQDFDTSILFGDAASATLLRRNGSNGSATLLRRPIVSAKGEDGAALRVPHIGVGSVQMNGKRVFGEAVRKMLAMLERACEDAQVSVDELSWIVPHQANGRIIDALATRLPLNRERVVNSIRRCGNTASSSIPLALEELGGRLEEGQRIGLCSFGGGFTFGAAVLQR